MRTYGKSVEELEAMRKEITQNARASSPVCFFNPDQAKRDRRNAKEAFVWSAVLTVLSVGLGLLLQPFLFPAVVFGFLAISSFLLGVCLWFFAGDEIREGRNDG